MESFKTNEALVLGREKRGDCRCVDFRDHLALRPWFIGRTQFFTNILSYDKRPDAARRSGT